MSENLHLRPERRNNITATEMATLFGLNPYESPRDLLDKKNNPQKIDSVHLRRGKLKEPSVLEAFDLDLGIKTRRHFDGTLLLEGHRIAATPDAYLLSSDDVVECKSVTTRNFEKWYSQVPTNYHIQVLVQMLVVGSSVGMIGALEEGDPYECEYRFAVWQMERSEEAFELMKEEVARFWQEVDQGKLYRVKSSNKAAMANILKNNSKLIYPTEIPLSKEKRDEEKLSEILSLFQ